MVRGCMDSNSCHASKLSKCKQLWEGFSFLFGLDDSCTYSKNTMHYGCLFLCCKYAASIKASQREKVQERSLHQSYCATCQSQNRNHQFQRMFLIHLWGLMVLNYKTCKARGLDPLFLEVHKQALSLRDWPIIYSAVTLKIAMTGETLKHLEKKHVITTC